MGFQRIETFECDVCARETEPADEEVEDGGDQPYAPVGWVSGTITMLAPNPDFERLNAERTAIIEGQMPEIVTGLQAQFGRSPTPAELDQAREMIGNQVAPVEEEPVIVTSISLCLCPDHKAKLTDLGLKLE